MKVPSDNEIMGGVNVLSYEPEKPEEPEEDSCIRCL